MPARLAYQPRLDQSFNAMPEAAILLHTGKSDPGMADASLYEPHVQYQADLFDEMSSRDWSEGEDDHGRAVGHAFLIWTGLIAGKPVSDADVSASIDFLLGYLDRQGRLGESPLSLHDSAKLTEWLSRAAYCAMLAGDQRLRAHPFFAYRAYWLMHQLQPGPVSYLTGTYQIDPWDRVRVNHWKADVARSTIAEGLLDLAVLYPSPEIKFWLETVNGGVPALNVPGVRALAETEVPADFSLPPYGFYPGAGLVLWRPDWNPQGEALLARGAVAEDPAAEHDAGQITYIVGGEPVLVEAREDAVVTDAAGEPVRIPAHNVVRVGGDAPLGGVGVPIITRQLDESGGNLRIDASAAHPKLSQAHRDLFWETGGELRMIDNLSYALGQRERTELFWHLGATAPVAIEQDGTRTIVEWGDHALVLQANQPVTVEQFLVPDGSDFPGAEHVVLRLQTIGRPPNLRVLTRVLPREARKTKE